MSRDTGKHWVGVACSWSYAMPKHSTMPYGRDGICVRIEPTDSTQYICCGLTGQRTARFGDLPCLISTLAIPVGGSKAPSAPAAPPNTNRHAVRNGHQ